MTTENSSMNILYYKKYFSQPFILVNVASTDFDTHIPDRIFSTNYLWSNIL